MRELEADDGMVDELLAEGGALVRVLDGFFVADAAEAHGLDDDADALVVEVGHDAAEALVFFAEQVGDGHFGVFEGDVRCSRAPHALAVHFSGRHAAVRALDEEEGHAVHARTAGAHGGGEVVAVDAVCDPFLGPVDDVVFPVVGEFGFAGQTCYVRPGVRLGDGEADAFLAREELGEDAVD